ncbi:MAG: hypothetical protein ACRC5C_08310 [Bacilli bacterium]
MSADKKRFIYWKNSPKERLRRDLIGVPAILIVIVIVLNADYDAMGKLIRILLLVGITIFSITFNYWKLKKEEQRRHID